MGQRFPPSDMEPFGQASGLINLFEHEYAGFTFWHGMASVTDSVDELKRWFALGQNNDIKIRVELENGETGLAKLDILSQSAEIETSKSIAPRHHGN